MSPGAARSFGYQTIQHPALRFPAPEEAGQPLCYCDIDNRGLFIRAIHATSSGHEAAIQQAGLRPLGDVRNAIPAYLALIAPGHDREVAQALESNGLRSGNVLAGGLILSRLDITADTPITFMLPLLVGVT
jgi:hypothetical protein